ncbi:uncharacterized protein TRIADDRAFT_54738 [Trichoplax adhaerens]|uniref:FZ domain-containing protein n=1 Tax=Trichoplax adhaerens TaxID=10228 RepID=B3RSV0_TRIAD|nr:predicted protein [Trichoplax adhaerens]EDV27111.1 predicted protein [Trichoplax adhaerens]|eukprot:XP_002111107.1 predicted protein [Trichoplax adhaerens]
MRFTLIVLGLLLVTCKIDQAHSHIAAFSEDDDFLRKLVEAAAKGSKEIVDDSIKAEINHIRKIRATSNTVKAWLDSDLNSCSLPSSKIGIFCNISYNSPTMLVRRLTKVLEFVIDRFSNIQSQFGSNCANIVKEIMCKGFIPQCSVNGSTATYGTFASSCAGMTACSSNLINIEGQTGPQICARAGTKIQLTQCQKYSPGTINSQICGSLPTNIVFPGYLTTDIQRKTLSIAASKTQLEKANVKKSCVDRWMKLLCVNTPFCSSDRKKLYSAVTRQQCQAAFNCLPSSFQGSSLLDCTVYPDQTSASVTLPPDQAYSGGGTATV